MQEFSSVTASSYDAESLAPLLNEKAADGWSVVAIVTAGTNIVAYLQRETDGVAETSGVDSSAAEAPAVEEPAAEETFEPVAEEPVAVEEPAGWAAVPDEQPAVAEETFEPVAEEPVVEEPVVETTPAAAESAVPAGWYADPSGRFELRYWDGNAWTEHVSRAGQQFTDPPVA